MHRSRLAGVVIDSHVSDIDNATAFWTKALGTDAVPCEEDWASQYVHLDVPDDQVRVLIQKVGHPSRVHIDIETDNIPAEVRRLERLGAVLVKEFPRWTVMEAPTGHRFCVVRPQRPDFSESEDVNVWDEDA